VNKDGFIAHKCVKSGLHLAFYVHVSEETRVFMLKHLRFELSIYLMMNNHKCKVKEMMENNGKLSRDLFLNEQDICNLARKLAQETYKKHENDA